MPFLSQTEYKLTEYAAETMVYFERHKLIEIAKKILVECSLERPSDPQEWIGENIKRIAREIYEDCQNNGLNGIVKSLHLSASFLFRIVMFGRPGSGRKTQAHNLVLRCNLVLIDAEVLIQQHLRGDDNSPYDRLDRELQRAFYYDNCLEKSKALLHLILRRLLEKDCLHRGWILINFTHYLQDFKDILENFKIPPNKLVYLACPQQTCMSRLLNMPDLGKPSHNCTYYEQEMRFFNNQKEQIESYLSKRYETICVDASPPSEHVKTAMMSALVKSPYVMGFRHNTRLTE